MLLDLKALSEHFARLVLMRILAIILLIQSAMVAWLVVRLDAVDRHLVRLSASTAPSALAVAPRPPAIPPDGMSADVDGGAASLSPEQIRAIIREELGEWLAAFSNERPVGTSSSDSAPAAHGRRAAAGDPGQTEEVAHALDYYVSVGRISDAEMGRLKSDIARLPDPERRRMLAKLVGALNSGQLEGRL
jgi:hypothetical protein